MFDPTPIKFLYIKFFKFRYCDPNLSCYAQANFLSFYSHVTFHLRMAQEYLQCNMMIVCWQGFLLLASDDKPKSSLPQKGALQSALYKTASVFNWLKLKIGGSVFHKFSKKNSGLLLSTRVFLVIQTLLSHNITEFNQLANELKQCFHSSCFTSGTTN